MFVKIIELCKVQAFCSQPSCFPLAPNPSRQATRGEKSNLSKYKLTNQSAHQFVVQLKGKETRAEPEVSSVSKASGGSSEHINKLPPPVPVQEEEEAPEWLDVLLRTKFWGQCKQHWDASRAEVCIFCLRCRQVLCPRCSHDEPGHRLLKVRRYMYRSVVLARDLQGLNVDVSRVQVSN
ncbi:Os03g0225400 [Oryza sativa Japonica Group]|uniref:Os03g0225400 protein n=1 Tax=Oryza sativa subsp. japonica TaxID=39947 RepID=A0A0P0VUX0_ORYSJ|nr:Os03g0225400 [Oryza sativa Japonica Group]